jgi:hypothetical protein
LERQARLEGARRALEGAKVLVVHGDFRGCVARCHYAVDQAMWVAAGEPEKKPRSEPPGILQPFVRGSWFDPIAGVTGPGVFERYRFPLRRRCDLRRGAPRGPWQHGGSVGLGRAIRGMLDISPTPSRIAPQYMDHSLVVERSTSGGRAMHTPMMALAGTVSRV